jgi:pre-mRNA-processing factor 8
MEWAKQNQEKAIQP